MIIRLKQELRAYVCMMLKRVFKIELDKIKSFYTKSVLALHFDFWQSKTPADGAMKNTKQILQRKEVTSPSEKESTRQDDNSDNQVLIKANYMKYAIQPIEILAFL